MAGTRMLAASKTEMVISIVVILKDSDYLAARKTHTGSGALYVAFRDVESEGSRSSQFVKGTMERHATWRADWRLAPRFAHLPDQITSIPILIRKALFMLRLTMASLRSSVRLTVPPRDAANELAVATASELPPALVTES
jgi:hypothetical protein